jgi:hypothetical protein
MSIHERQGRDHGIRTAVDDCHGRVVPVGLDGRGLGAAPPGLDLPPDAFAHRYEIVTADGSAG